MLKQKGSASKMKPMGSDESYMTHQNHPLDAGWIDGHGLNAAYKVPPAHPSGRENLSYMHPHKTPGREYAPKMKGPDPFVSNEKALRNTMPKGGGKIIAPQPQGKNKV